MRRLTLYRIRLLHLCTFGFIDTGERVYYTLELPWLNNARNMSCIPEGEYQCDYIPSSSSGKYRSVYHVKDVQDRSGILIHAGNLPEQTKGCILLGKRIGRLKSQSAVLNSRTALREFVRDMNSESFTLRVKKWIG